MCFSREIYLVIEEREREGEHMCWGNSEIILFLEFKIRNFSLSKSHKVGLFELFKHNLMKR